MSHYNIHQQLTIQGSSKKRPRKTGVTKLVKSANISLWWLRNKRMHTTPCILHFCKHTTMKKINKMEISYKYFMKLYWTWLLGYETFTKWTLSFYYDHEGRLTADKYIRDILTHPVLPICGNELNHVMHDNAPPQKAHMTRTFLEEENVIAIEWPAVSPDINPIENAWSFMKRGLRKLDRCRDSQHLFYILVKIWESLTPEFIFQLTSSMSWRLQAVLEVNGGHTDY